MAPKQSRGILDRIRDYALAITLVSGVLAGAYSAYWNMVVTPSICKTVKKETEPLEIRIEELIKGQEYHTYLFMSTLSDSQIEWATKRFLASVRSRGQ